MHTYYENTDIQFKISEEELVHKGPHVIDAIELVLVTEGTFAAGLGTDLFPAAAGDLVVLFPDLIRHTQIFGVEKPRAICLTASPDLVPAFQKLFATKAPENPVLPAKKVHPDILYAMRALLAEKYKALTGKGKTITGTDASIIGKGNMQVTLARGYLEVILSRITASMAFTDKAAFISDDIIDRVVSYIAANFQDPLSLTKMAADLYVSPYAVSRIFSSTFHTNFNGYLNHTRVEYAKSLLSTDRVNVTEAWTEAGFESQRTFNRVFKDTYHMSPSEFRRQVRAAE